MIATKKIEFGDFQTPQNLANEIAVFLRNSGEAPDMVVEPTCGLGSFVVAAMAAFPRAKAIYGFDINPHHVREAVNTSKEHGGRKPKLECKDFFQVDWVEFFAELTGTILVIGNPPWVTNSVLGTLGSQNLPEKTNFQGYVGFAAKTGKANFDISEWMLIRITEALHRRAGCVAMLCKTATARKTLRHAWLNRLNIGRCSLHLIDAKKHFGASVDACLLIIHTGIVEPAATACVYSDLSFNSKVSTLGLVGKELVADIDEFLRLRDIDGIPYYTWRSGVKHDAAGVMEFKRDNGHYTNGKEEECRLETTYLFPLLKSSDIANARMTPERYVLLTQRKPAEDTAGISKIAPKTWAYLTEHSDALDQRRSIIYEKRPRFSIFGVGDYTFSPWKVAISGLYKTCRFEVVGEHHGKPIVLDDTCYFIPCASEDESRFICELLNSDICQRFLRSLVFLDAKRPVTIDILNRIDLKRVAERVNRVAEAQKFLSAAAGFEDRQPLLVFEKKAKYRVKRGAARSKS
ncbi:MAG: SAM-dependent DNA methyltransferase [bacterium]